MQKDIPKVTNPDTKEAGDLSANFSNLVIVIKILIFLDLSLMLPISLRFRRVQLINK